ncbi:MAG: LysE family translocator [Emcibacteraceae bacterium]|nr:LysE family translocator [Emcibacteraceae bacterium]
MSFIFAIGLYAFSMSATPGPTNILLLSSGVRHGFIKSVPFVTGAAIGFTLLNIIIALGINEFGSDHESFLKGLSYVGAGFISYMGYKLASSVCDLKYNENSELNDNAPGFLSGMFLQWINPKAWIACVAGVSAFITAGNREELILYVSIYVVVGYLSILTWAYAGSKIALFLGNCRNLKIFNLTMGGGLILIAGYLLFV